MQKQIPNIFTLLNLFFGCLAIVYILQTQAYDVEYTAEEQLFIKRVPTQWMYASLFIAIAAIIDFLDGFVARFLNATSELGKQLDSLADVVSFGVAPSLIIYQMLRLSYMQQVNGLDVNTLYLVPAFIVACAAAYRLGKFNITPSKGNYFTGVPVPAIGLTVAAFPLILHYNTLGINSLFLNKWFLYLVIGLLSYLMLCKYKILALKFSSFSIKKLMPFIIIVGIAVIAAFFVGWLAVPIGFLAYVALSLLHQKDIN